MQTVKPHVPLIKFRKGGLPAAAAEAASSSHPSEAAEAMPPPLVSEAAAPLEAAAKKGAADQWAPVSVSLEWWQTPDKYRRRAIDESECEIINVRKFRGDLPLSPLTLTFLPLFQMGGRDQPFN